MDRPQLHGLRRLVSVATYPALLLGATAFTWHAQQRGLSPFLTSFVAIAAVWLLVGGLERYLPFRTTWYVPLRVWGVDLIHSLVSANVVLPILKITSFAAIAAGSAKLAELSGGSLWPSSLPVAVQVVAAVLVADLGAYLAHRFMHVTRVGWLMHAVHHSPNRLDFLAAGRSHPFNAALTLTCENGLLLLVGASPELMVVFSIYKGTNGLLQHANIDLRTGALGYVIATQDQHRWHHSKVLEESNTNFGNTNMVWDHVFRSYFRPSDRFAPDMLGIDNAEIPENYLDRLRVPFALARFEHTEENA